MRKEFAVHMLNDLGKTKAHTIANAFETLLNTLEQTMSQEATLSGREMAIVRTKLEEAAFFAKKAMAQLPENQQ